MTHLGLVSFQSQLAFFRIYDSKFNLHPVPYLSQASESRISHSVLLFCISEYPLNGFLPCFVHPLDSRRAASLLRDFHIVAPDVPGHDLREILALGAKMPGGAVQQTCGLLLHSRQPSRLVVLYSSTRFSGQMKHS